jgi:hypothetical protein
MKFITIWDGFRHTSKYWVPVYWTLSLYSLTQSHTLAEIGMASLLCLLASFAIYHVYRGEFWKR